ncbi:MAG: TlpA disulfide reductase family protein [Hyphomicrobium sp.]|nr:TlpA disulfide reductase family protein [Hyphomicrobium sp.]
MLGVLATAAVPIAPAAEEAAKFKIGDTAPDFTLQEIGGRRVQLSSVNKGKVVLLAFWSLRCGACIQEIPFLERLHKNSGGQAVAVLSVVTDGVDAAATKTIMKEIGISPSYPVLVDPDFTASDMYTDFVVPHTLVIDRKGIIRYVHTGFEPGTEKQYEAALKKALEF